MKNETETVLKTNEAGGNELLAKFMGHKPKIEADRRYYWMDYDDIGEETCHHHDDLRFNTSWNWLMPVVHKLYEVISEDDQSFAGLTLFELGLATDMKTIYNSSVEAVKWLLARGVSF